MKYTGQSHAAKYGLLCPFERCALCCDTLVSLAAVPGMSLSILAREWRGLDERHCDSMILQIKNELVGSKRFIMIISSYNIILLVWSFKKMNVLQRSYVHNNFYYHLKLQSLRTRWDGPILPVKNRGITSNLGSWPSRLVKAHQNSSICNWFSRKVCCRFGEKVVRFFYVIVEH